MLDHAAHEKFAFHYTCMNHSSYRCRIRSFDVCGNDEMGLAWQTNVEVPSVYEDGVYVFGWSWYGGGDFTGFSFFGDYYACSFVRIMGGVSVKNSFQAQFNDPSCFSSVDKLGICWSEPCRVGRVQELVPASFANGALPNPILRSDIIAYGGGVPHDKNVVAHGAWSKDRERSRPISKKMRVVLLNLKTFHKVDVKDGAVYQLSDFPKGLTVEALYSGNEREVDFVEFYIDDVLMRREHEGPFVMNGNRGQQLYQWDMPIGRMVKVSVRAIIHSGQEEKSEADIEFI